MAVKEGGAYSVMCAYNQYNGTYASENKTLLVDILKDEWEFDGVVISDWGAVHSTKEAAFCGMDLEMSVTYNFDEYFFANPLKCQHFSESHPQSPRHQSSPILQ